MAKKPDRESNDAGELPDLFEAHLIGPSETVLRAIAKHELDVGCRHATVEPSAEDAISVQIFASAKQLDAIESEGLRVKRGDNVSAIARERFNEVGRGDRYEGGRSYPEGLGTTGRDPRQEDAS